jgi:ubiquinone/menaquinone biosynthesis C-methylase UbiE
MSKKIYELYKNLYSKYGNSPASVKARNTVQQSLRFKYLLECLSIKNNESVIDIGCGLGDFSKYLRKNKIKCKYLGVDFLEEFIDVAKKKNKSDSNSKFTKLDIHKQKFPKNYDWLILSGLFNDKDKNSEKSMIKIITKMFRASRKGIVFNSLSKYVDYEDKKLFYSNPNKIFDYCAKNLSKYLILKTNYQLKKNTIPFEYTMAVFKKCK